MRHISPRTCLSVTAPPFPTLFFFNATAPTDIYTLSLHDALPICLRLRTFCANVGACVFEIASLRVEHRPRNRVTLFCTAAQDRKSTRLNSSHRTISYAVFCLKKKTILLYLPVQRIKVREPLCASP